MTTTSPVSGFGDTATKLAILALAIGSFGIGTGEFAIMGLLPNLARDMLVSEPEAGHVISAYALGVVVGAPLFAVLFAKAPRKPLMLWLMGLFALGNFGSAMAPDYLSLIGLRFVAGLPHGAYFGIAALIAASMVDVGYRARAVGRVMLGLTLATLIGMPLATWLGQYMGWRPTFAGVGLIGVVALAMIVRFVPVIQIAEGASPLRELGALKRPQVWLTLGIAAVGCGGMFSVFTYIVPLLTEVAHVPVVWVPVVLALFGVGMTLGNILGAAMADKALMPTIGGMLVFNVISLAVIPWTAQFWLSASISVFLVGFTVAIGTALQTRLMDVAADGQTLAATLNHAAFNIGNALGALFGGMSIAAGFGWASTGPVGAVMAVGGLALFVVSELLDKHRSRWESLDVVAQPAE
ncbi:MFS transporter [Devosia psychrophila]|uniref:MFS transporter n=1 Tax=Devosia psychrophila TaxID=728005 RepID=A0A0F5PRK8_9HYPH|nr:MFS transporter [Devosia psychrophila]KKC31278.1 MFS transporter [Devosia psychrophila]SFC91544.1 MFS transporter, DHA1 family, arabinose polymer transporter [Devosia psychrophila]